jgi:hypothetical protein
VAVPPLPDPVPTHLPPGFVAFPDHPLEATGVPLATGPTTPVQVPMTSRVRQYVPAPPSVEALDRGPVVRVSVSYAASFPPEWFDGLTGAPVEISGSDGYYRASGDQVSLIILRGAWVVEVMTAGVSEAETLAIAGSLNLA